MPLHIMIPPIYVYIFIYGIDYIGIYYIHIGIHAWVYIHDIVYTYTYSITFHVFILRSEHVIYTYYTIVYILVNAVVYVGMLYYDLLITHIIHYTLYSVHCIHCIHVFCRIS